VQIFAELGTVPLDGFDHPERRQSGSLGIVFVSLGRSEESKQAIPHKARHGPTVLVDRGTRALQGAIKDHTRALCAQAINEVGGSDHVREKDGYEFVFGVGSGRFLHRSLILLEKGDRYCSASA